MRDLANARAAPLCHRAPPEMSIPSPYVGEGGYHAMDFDDASEATSEASDEEKVSFSAGEGPPSTSPITSFQAATQVYASDSASESGMSAPPSRVSSEYSRVERCVSLGAGGLEY